jgi:hypothetical protein
MMVVFGGPFQERVDAAVVMAHDIRSYPSRHSEPGLRALTQT